MHGKRLAFTAIFIFTAVFLLSSASVWASSTVLKKEMQGNEVTALQKDLKKLGYLSIEPTGFYGDVTVEAVKAMQKEYGYEPDGMAGYTTFSLIDRLLGRNSDAKTVQKSSSGTSAVLKDGMESAEVTALQKDLVRLGYLSTEPTGYFGEATVSAVKKLQKKYGYEPDGMAGSSTLLLVEKLVAGSGSKTTGKTLAKAAAKTVTKAVATTADTTATKAVDTTADATATKVVDTTSATTATKAVDTTADATATKPADKKVSSETQKTNYLLPWFNTVNNLFAIGDTATVYDIDSGLSFKVKRTYGHNHADCEALTARDTAIMKKVFGGEWSWTRRAVIISVNGKKIAASIAGMPHAGRDKYAANKYISSRSGGYGRGENLDAVKGNNMNGHFDIHFYGSRTHDTNRIDSEHQKMVKKAAEWAKENL